MTNIIRKVGRFMKSGARKTAGAVRQRARQIAHSMKSGKSRIASATKSGARKITQSMKSGAGRIARSITREIREVASAVSAEGIDVKRIESKEYSGGVKATDFEVGQRPQVFTPSTIILNSGYGVWELDVPREVLSQLVDMTLKVETIRTHGMLHTPPFDRSIERRYARILVNGDLVDEISLVKPHPHGSDYGVDSRRPFQVFRYINRKDSVQEIRLEVDNKVLWDIDGITLEPIIVKTEITPRAAIVIGVVGGAVLSLLLSLWIL